MVTLGSTSVVLVFGAAVGRAHFGEATARQTAMKRKCPPDDLGVSQKEDTANQSAVYTGTWAPLTR